MQITTAIRNAVLPLLIATDGILDPVAVFIGLYTASSPQGVNTVLGDLTLAPGALATATDVGTWGTPYVLTDGRSVVDGAPQTFRPATSADFCVATGWYMADTATAGTLLAFEPFPVPIPLPTTTSQVTIIPRITIDPDGRWSASVAYNG